MAIHLPFDFEYFIPLFAGNTTIFAAIAILGILALAAYFRMTNMIAIMGVAIFGILLMTYGITENLFLLIVIVGVIIIVPVILRIFNR